MPLKMRMGAPVYGGPAKSPYAGSVALAMRGALLGTAIALAAAPAAGAEVFWANKYQDAIGHAASGGTDPDPHFIPLAPQSHPVGVAIDRGHVYWTSYELPDAIGRANLDGTGAEPAFITGAADPVGLAVDGAHVYWTNARSGTIGRANLDGSCVDQSFITRAHRPYGLAVEGGHIYWTNLNTGQIGRANIDGTAVDQGFIGGVPNPTSLAADSGHLYWVRNESNGATDGAVGRVRLDGSVSEPDFIPLSGQIPWGVGVDAGHLYWSNPRD